MSLFRKHKNEQPADGWTESDDPEIAELMELEAQEAAERAAAGSPPPEQQPDED